MRKVSNAQRIKIREQMIFQILLDNGVDPINDRIGGRQSARQYARSLSIEVIGQFAIQRSASLMESKLHELGGDQEATWRFMLEHYFPGEEPAGDEESRIVTATPAQAQGVIDQAAMFREGIEKGKHNA